MVNNISWGSYWSVLFIAVIIYYAYVLLVYYRGDLRTRLTGKNNLLPAGNFKPTHLPNQEQSDSESNDQELLPVVQLLTDEVTAYLEQASHAGAVKPEIIFALKQITKKYGSVKTSPYQTAVNSLLQFECGSKCAVHLSEAEIRQVWMD